MLFIDKILEDVEFYRMVENDYNNHRLSIGAIRVLFYDYSFCKSLGRDNKLVNGLKLVVVLNVQMDQCIFRNFHLQFSN